MRRRKALNPRIICPLAVMEQWATECRTKTEKGLLKVTTHHGPKRAKSGDELKKFDVVITTFQVLASEMAILQKAKPKTASNGKKTALDSDSDSDVPLPIKKSRAKANERGPTLFQLKWLRVVVGECGRRIMSHRPQTRRRTSRTTRQRLHRLRACSRPSSAGASLGKSARRRLNSS